MAVPVSQSDDQLAFGAPERLFDSSDFTSTTPLRSWDVAPDGRFLMVKDTVQGRARVIEQMVLVQGWTEELKRLVPANKPR